jgi:hypothetical protein
VVLAERRIGQELIEAQKRGELRSDAGRPKIVPDENDYTSTHEEIRITRRQAYDFRQMADLDDTDVEEIAAEARERGRPVAKADFKRKAAAKRRQPEPPIVRPPDHVSYMSLWLRNGVRAVQQFRDHRECLAMLDRYQVRLDHGEVVAVVEFLAALCAAMEADRAA